MKQQPPAVVLGRGQVSINQSFQFVKPDGFFTPCDVVVVTQMTAGKLHSPVLLSATEVPAGCTEFIDDWARKECGLAALESLFKARLDPVQPIPRDQRLAIIVEILSFATGWLHGAADENDSYRTGAIEAAGHMAACCICQWFHIPTGVGTAETIEALDLENEPDRAALRASLAKYVTELERNAE